MKIKKIEQEFITIKPCSQCSHRDLDFSSKYSRCYVGGFLIKEPFLSTCKKFNRNKNVKMIIVESSNIESLGYDLDKEELFVEFKHGATYKYSDVPEAVFKSFLKADSKGQFLNSEIKGVYSCKKM